MRCIPGRAILLAMALVMMCGCHAKKAAWTESTSAGYWKETSCSMHAGSDTTADIRVLLQEKQQVVDGFGACFNELGWDALRTLTKAKREEVLRNLWEPLSGLNLRICRMPIGANDYARSWYSLDDSAGDFALKYFSLERDRQTLIPYIKAAMRYNPDLQVWGSPWCPPAWMKTNGHYACRPDTVNDLDSAGAGMENKTGFRMQQKYLETYAAYFVKYIKAYRNEGINLFAVHVQNEPNSCQNFPSCIWTAQDMNTFIGKFLGPAVQSVRPAVQLWYGTIERASVEKVDTVLQDPLSSKYVSGVAFQWAGKFAIPAVHAHYPEMKLMQSETECGDGSNDWNAAVYTFGLMKHYFDNGVSIYSFWNPVLDETGKSKWGWKQNSLVTVDTKRQAIVYNPEYYLLKHFSHYIKPGARKLALAGKAEHCLAFLNPGNQLVLIIYNEKPGRAITKISFGNQFIDPDLAPGSLNTFVIPLTE